MGTIPGEVMTYLEQYAPGWVLELLELAEAVAATEPAPA